MDVKITRTNEIQLRGQSRYLSIKVVNGKITVAVTYPGSYRDDAQTLESDALSKTDAKALYDFLGEFIKGD